MQKRYDLHAVYLRQEYRHIIFNIYRSSAATMVTRTPLIVTCAYCILFIFLEIRLCVFLSYLPLLKRKLTELFLSYFVPRDKHFLSDISPSHLMPC